MKIIKTILLSLFALIVLLSFSLPEKASADTYSGNLQVSAKVKSSFKIGKSLKLTVYVKDGNGQKVKDAQVNVYLSQITTGYQPFIQSNQVGIYYGLTNKSGKVKFKIDTNNMTPNIPCTINVSVRYGNLISGGITLVVYPSGKYKIPLQAHIVANVTQIKRGEKIILKVIGDNLIANNYIYRTVWERACMGDTTHKNKFADVYSDSTTWDSIVAPPRTICVEFKAVIYDKLGRQTTAYLTLPYSD